MAFVPLTEGVAVGVAAAEALAGVVAGWIAAVESHHHHGSNNDSGVADDGDGHDPGGTGVPDDKPGGTTHDDESYVQHADSLEISYANEVTGNWRAYQMRKLKRRLRDGYYNLPEFMAIAAKKGLSAVAAYHAYRNIIRTIRERDGVVVQHTPIIDRRRRAMTAGLAGAAGLPRAVVRGLFPH